MKNKAIKILAIGAVILFVLLALTPIINVSAGKPKYLERKLIKTRTVRLQSTIEVTLFYDDGWATVAIYDLNWHILKSWEYQYKK